MRKNVYKIATICLMGTLSVAGKSMIAKAYEVPVAGINVILDDYYDSVQNNYEESEQAKVEQTVLEQNQSTEESEYEDLAIASVYDYVNVRKGASEESKILGKLYNNSAATILEQKGEWLKIKSGDITGFVKAEFVVYGKDVESIAKKVAKKYATVNTTTLKVREKASQDSEVLTLVPIGDELSVKKEVDGWVKISNESDILGYVSSEYVDLRTEYKEAISLEEEARIEAKKKRIAQEKARMEEERRREEAAQSVEESNSQSSNSSGNRSSSGSVQNNTNYNRNQKPAPSSNTSNLRKAIVQYALRFQGNPYVWGGTSLTNGADCSGFTQSVFRDNGISIPRTSRTQASGGGRVISVSQMQPGDLIFYDRSGTINHVGIYIGSGKIISASTPETGIRITNYNYREPVKVVNYID